MHPARLLTLSTALIALATGVRGHIATDSSRSDRLATADGGARIEVEPASHDFGKVYEGTVARHVFIVRSAGEEPLVIHKVQPSCGCTVSEIWQVDEAGERSVYEEGRALEPGETLELEVNFKTANRKGRQEKTVKIFANIPEGSTQVRISANVRPFLVFTPQRITFERFSVREEAQASADVRTHDGQPVALTMVQEDLPEGLAVELLPVDPDEEGRARAWRIEAHVSTGAPEGPFHHMLGLRSRDPDPESGSARESRIPIGGQIVGLVSATPRYITFGVLRGESVAKTLRLNVNAEDVEVEAPTFELFAAQEEEPFAHADACQVTIRQVEDVKGAWDVELLVGELPADLKGPFRGRLRLTFDHPELAPMWIPFSGFHRPPTASRVSPHSGSR